MKPKTRKDMIAYLSDHFRYYTGNSWNGVTSYAANVKLYNLKFPSREIAERAYDLLQTEEAFDEIKWIMEEFNRSQAWKYQVGFNGRSGGYIVLYQGGRRQSEHKSYCPHCGQRNFQEATPESNKCGRCGKDGRVNHVFYETFIYPGKGLDHGEDFEKWDTYSLKQRVHLVWEFDKMVEACIKAFIEFCSSHAALEEEYFVAKTRLVAVEVA